MAMSALYFLYPIGPYLLDVGMYALSLPVPCLDRVPWVWQCLLYISHTLLGHTLGTLAMSGLFSCPICLHYA